MSSVSSASEQYIDTLADGVWANASHNIHITKEDLAGLDRAQQKCVSSLMNGGRVPVLWIALTRDNERGYNDNITLDGTGGVQIDMSGVFSQDLQDPVLRRARADRADVKVINHAQKQNAIFIFSYRVRPGDNFVFIGMGFLRGFTPMNAGAQFPNRFRFTIPGCFMANQIVPKYINANHEIKCHYSLKAGMGILLGFSDEACKRLCSKMPCYNDMGLLGLGNLPVTMAI